jgi:hypothetical protein
MSRSTNYDKAYELIRAKLEVLTEPITLGFLGRTFCADKNGVEQIGGDPIHINAKGVIVWYLTFGGRNLATTPESFDFAPLNHFSYGIFSGSSAWEKSRASRLSKLTAARFRENANRIGAEFLRSERYGESWLLFPFPELPLLLTFSEGDEEFQPSLNIKLGKNCERILPFETLAVLIGLIESEFGD